MKLLHHWQNLANILLIRSYKLLFPGWCKKCDIEKEPSQQSWFRFFLAQGHWFSKFAFKLSFQLSTTQAKMKGNDSQRLLLESDHHLGDWKRGNTATSSFFLSTPCLQNMCWNPTLLAWVTKLKHGNSVRNDVYISKKTSDLTPGHQDHLEIPASVSCGLLLAPHLWSQGYLRGHLNGRSGIRARSLWAAIFSSKRQQSGIHEHWKSVKKTLKWWIQPATQNGRLLS